MTIFVEAV